MPVFDFVCKKCKKKFSELVLGSEKIKCPACNSIAVEKVFSSFNTISEGTRLETNASDLPSMDEWRRKRSR